MTLREDLKAKGKGDVWYGFCSIVCEMSFPKELMEQAFSEFHKASELLATYYGLLEREIQALKRELEEKQNEIERGREELQLILDSLPVGVALFEGDRLLFSNAYMRALDTEELVRAVAGLERTQGELKRGTAYYRWKKREIRNGHEEKRLLVFEDVTEIEKAKQRDELERRLVAMGEMALRIAHEIKNPLSSVEIFLSMLRHERKRKRYVEYALFGLKTIERIISNILTYTRPRQVMLRPGVLSHLVKETLDFMSASLDKEGIRIEFESLFDSTTWFDPDLMRLVVMNLLANARDAVGQRGRIGIRLKGEGEYVVLTVADDGAGMEEEIKKDIFNPFFTTKEKGLGLGLFIVYNVVKAHKGYIDVESKKGEGTAFHVYLPMDGR